MEFLFSVLTFVCVILVFCLTFVDRVCGASFAHCSASLWPCMPPGAPSGPPTVPYEINAAFLDLASSIPGCRSLSNVCEN